MKNKKIIDMYEDDFPTWKRWKKKRKMNNAELLHTIITHGVNKVLFDTFMRSLTSRDDYKRPLKNVNICKERRYKISIEKRGATCG